MGHTCSKSAGQLDYAQAGALESDPRQRRCHKKKSNPSLTASGSQNYCHSNVRLSSHGIFKSDPALFHLQQMSLKLLESSNRFIAGQDHLLYKQQHKFGRSNSDTSVTVRKRSQAQTGVSALIPFSAHNEQSPLQSVQNLASVEVDHSKKTLGASVSYNTRLVIRRHVIRSAEEGVSGRHIYAVRWPRNTPLQLTGQSTLSIQPPQEQSPYNASTDRSQRRQQSSNNSPTSQTRASAPQQIPARPKAIATSKNVSTVAARSSGGVIGPSLVDSFFHASILASPPRRKGTFSSL